MTMRAFITCVNYADYLAVTLPYNRHHFSEIVVITTPTDKPTLHLIAQHRLASTITTLFHDNDAPFAKYRALEYALDQHGREDWICLLDADTLWPKNATLPNLSPGTLYGPSRRIAAQHASPPPEPWDHFPISKNSTIEFPGYSQIFHAQDPHLGTPPWHDITINHAGAGDSWLHMKWPKQAKHRLPWYALHLGQTGRHWRGRGNR